MLVEHAQREMNMVGLFDADADYGGLVAKSVMELMETFAAQGHSGESAMQVLELFGTLARYKTLSPITSNPEEWMDVSEVSAGPMWQSRRCPSVFSRDGGKTWYDLDAPSAS